MTGEHHVTVRLTYTSTGDPYKWRGWCACGWRCMSWQWVAVDRPGGALPMSLVHLALTRPPG